MSYLLWQRDDGAGIASDRQVLRAQEVPLLESAAALVQHLGQLVAGRAEHLQAEVQDARALGHAQGVAQGRAAAQAALADQLLQLQAAQREQHAQVQAEVAALALAVARRLLGELAPLERLGLLAEQAARELLPQPTIKLHVHPQRVDGLRRWRDHRVAQAGAEGLRGQASALGAAEFCPDTTLALDDCRLETALGSADASLAAQLGRLAEAWGLPEPQALLTPQTLPTPQELSA